MALSFQPKSTKQRMKRVAQTVLQSAGILPGLILVVYSAGFPLLGLCISHVSAQDSSPDGAIIRMEPVSTEYKISETLEIDVYLDMHGKSANSAEVAVKFCPDVLTLATFDLGRENRATQELVTIDNEHGVVDAPFMWLDGVDKDDVLLGKLKFKVKDDMADCDVKFVEEGTDPDHTTGVFVADSTENVAKNVLSDTSGLHISKGRVSVGDDKSVPVETAEAQTIQDSSQLIGGDYMYSAAIYALSALSGGILAVIVWEAYSLIKRPS